MRARDVLRAMLANVIRIEDRYGEVRVEIGPVEHQGPGIEVSVQDEAGYGVPHAKVALRIGHLSVATWGRRPPPREGDDKAPDSIPF